MMAHWLEQMDCDHFASLEEIPHLSAWPFVHFCCLLVPQQAPVRTEVSQRFLTGRDDVEEKENFYHFPTSVQSLRLPPFPPQPLVETETFARVLFLTVHTREVGSVGPA